jgi:hypothetical protein
MLVVGRVACDYSDEGAPVAKKDITQTISAADRLLETTENPLHRQILENYRRHAILETTGRWEGIFDPDSTVDEPFYILNIIGFPGVRAAGQQVRDIYRTMAEQDTTVMVVEQERLMVSDWGFASDALFNKYLRGRDLLAKGVQVDDPEGYYIHQIHYAMIWPYDDRGRMIGENVYQDMSHGLVTQVPAEDYLTVDDARERLLPLLRPLPRFAPQPATA